MDDSEPSTREAAAEAVGTLMKLVSEKSLYPYIEKLDKIKEAKVKDYYQKASGSNNAMNAAPLVKKSPKSVPKPQLSVRLMFLYLRRLRNTNQRLNLQSKL
jgi:hypothetical protein